MPRPSLFNTISRTFSAACPASHRERAVARVATSRFAVLPSPPTILSESRAARQRVLRAFLTGSNLLARARLRVARLPAAEHGQRNARQQEAASPGRGSQIENQDIRVALANAAARMTRRQIIPKLSPQAAAEPPTNG